MCYIILMKTRNRLPYIGKVQDINDEFNKAFADEVMMPMVKTAVTIIFVAVIIDFSFQMIEAIDILTN